MNKVTERFRPTVKMYRELEKENNSLKELLGKMGDMEGIVRDNTIYRQALLNFHQMMRKKRDPALLVQGSEECDCLISIVYKDIVQCINTDVPGLIADNNALKKSNDLMEKELDRLRSCIKERTTVIENLRGQLARIKIRNLWSRIINKF